CIGGRGAIEDNIMPRLYREAPINAIWEGSGNIQCLDVLRAVQKQPEALQAFVTELEKAQGANELFDAKIMELKKNIAVLKQNPAQVQFRARALVGDMALAIQAAVLLQADQPLTAEAYCRSRLDAASYSMYSALTDHGASAGLIQHPAASTGPVQVPPIHSL